MADGKGDTGIIPRKSAAESYNRLEHCGRGGDGWEER